MLVTFRSPASADVVMFGDVARDLLAMMGRSGRVPSALRSEEVPKALLRLRKALGELPKDEEIVPSAREDGDDGETPVSLRTRAYPLVELLEAAVRQREYVMWDSR